MCLLPYLAACITHYVSANSAKSGLAAVSCDASQTSIAISSAQILKRKRRGTDLEIADSDDEDYGWGEEDDDNAPPQPSQWQGSEDLILGTQPPSEGEDGFEGEEGEDVQTAKEEEAVQEELPHSTATGTRSHDQSRDKTSDRLRRQEPRGEDGQAYRKLRSRQR